MSAAEFDWSAPQLVCRCGRPLGLLETCRTPDCLKDDLVESARLDRRADS